VTAAVEKSFTSGISLNEESSGSASSDTGFAPGELERLRTLATIGQFNKVWQSGICTGPCDAYSLSQLSQNDLEFWLD